MLLAPLLPHVALLELLPDESAQLLMEKAVLLSSSLWDQLLDPHFCNQGNASSHPIFLLPCYAS